MAPPAEVIDGDRDRVVELIPTATAAVSAAPTASGAAAAAVVEEIQPLLTRPEMPIVSIFSGSYPGRKPREPVTRLSELEIPPCSPIISWVWSGSRYSGLLCMALSSTVYFIMEAVSDSFSVQSIPLFETVFARSMIITLLSYSWLRKSQQPILGPVHVRKLLVSRALMGYLSLFSFVFCVQRLPMSQAVVLSLTTPISASFVARFILNENLKVGDLGGLACSYFGVLFTFGPVLNAQGGLMAAGEARKIYVRGSHHIYAVLGGLLSSVAGGISYCLVRAAAKASDQPMVTVFSFSIFACPAAAICTLTFQKFVLPGFYSFLLMIALGVLAFFAEVFLARALHLEKTSKVANIQYMEDFSFASSHAPISAAALSLMCRKRELLRSELDHLLSAMNDEIMLKGFASCCPIAIMEHWFIKASSILWQACWMFAYLDFSILYHVLRT